MSNQVLVRLRDSGSIFHDLTQDPKVTVRGKDVVSISMSERVRKALSTGVLIKATQQEAALYEKEQASKEKTDVSSKSDSGNKTDDSIEEGIKEKTDDTSSLTKKVEDATKTTGAVKGNKK